MDIAGIVVRWLHIVSVVTLIGAAVYSVSTRSVLAESFRSRIYVAMALLLGSGFYQFLTKTGGFPKGYHMWFGIKMLLALHILSVFLLLALGRGDESKQRRWAAGIAISGLLTILLSSILRSLSQGN